jgi:hypothetical protein
MISGFFVGPLWGYSRLKPTCFKTGGAPILIFALSTGVRPGFSGEDDICVDRLATTLEFRMGIVPASVALPPLKQTHALGSHTCPISGTNRQPHAVTAGRCFRNGPKLGSLSCCLVQRLDAPEPLYGVGSLTEYGFTAGARDNAGTLGLEQQCGVGTCHQHPNERGLVLTCLGLPCSVTQSQFPLRVRARK